MPIPNDVQAGDPIRAREHNAVLAELRRLSANNRDLSTELRSLNIRTGGLVEPEWFIGEIVNQGPKAEADYISNRYWLVEQYSSDSSGGTSDGVTLADMTGRGRYLTGTNLDEQTSGSHLLAINGTVFVHVFAIRDSQAPGVLRYIFFRVPTTRWAVAQADQNSALDPPTVSVQLCDDKGGTNPSGTNITCGLTYLAHMYPNVRAGDVFRVLPDPDGEYACLPFGDGHLDLPVGSVLHTTDSSDPRLSRGWEIIAKRRVLAGYESGAPYYGGVRGTGGADTHTHPDHPVHNHEHKHKHWENQALTFNRVDVSAGTLYAVDYFSLAIDQVLTSDPDWEFTDNAGPQAHSAADHRDAYYVVLHIERTS